MDNLINIDIPIIRSDRTVHVYFYLHKQENRMHTQTGHSLLPLPNIETEDELRIYIDTYPPAQADRLVKLFPILNLLIQSIFQKQSGENLGRELVELSEDNMKMALRSLQDMGQ